MSIGKYLTDENGNPNGVLLTLAEYQQVMDDLEELDEVREYDEAKCRPSEPVPFDQAVREIRQGVVR